MGRQITVYGDGKQVRDVLCIEDLVDLYVWAVELDPGLQEFVFSVGGGPEQAVLLRDVIHILEREVGHPVELCLSDWRPGDQRVYVSDTRAACQAFQWTPKVFPEEGIALVMRWIQGSRHLFQQIAGTP